jgi:hypothetical protein
MRRDKDRRTRDEAADLAGMHGRRHAFAGGDNVIGTPRVVFQPKWHIG